MATWDVMGEKQKVLISEFDLFDYAGVFLKSVGEGTNAFSIIQPKCPIEYQDDGDRRHKILKEADYVAKTQGTRTFPWRYMLITQNDGQLVESTMPVRLAPANAIGETDWIKVGQTCWDWLNGIPFGPDVLRQNRVESVIAFKDNDIFRTDLQFASLKNSFPRRKVITRKLHLFAVQQLIHLLVEERRIYCSDTFKVVFPVCIFWRIDAIDEIVVCADCMRTQAASHHKDSV